MKRLSDKQIREIYEQCHRPMYIYENNVIAKQASSLVKTFEGFEFLYSIKTNPFVPVVKTVFAAGIGADAASAAEVELAAALGLSREKILFSAPGKTRRDILRTLDKSIIIADSLNELAMINEVACSCGETQRVGIRINPDFTMFTPKGAAGKFGVDAELLMKEAKFLRALKNIEVTGIHIHVRSQILAEDLLARYYERIFDLAATCQDKHGWNLEFINFGGGIGIPYSADDDAPLDLPLLGKKCAELIRMNSEKLPDIRLIIESGRFLVGHAGLYITPVVDVKESRGVRYVVVENGLNGFLRPAVAELLASIAGESLSGFSAEPLFTVRDAFGVRVCGKNKGKREKVTIVGNLCTATDIVASDITLPQIAIDDLIVLSNAGSYAYSLSPLLFSSHEVPLQLLVDKHGEEMK